VTSDEKIAEALKLRHEYDAAVKNRKDHGANAVAVVGKAATLWLAAESKLTPREYDLYQSRYKIEIEKGEK
jgi:hypothetical protein